MSSNDSGCGAMVAGAALILGVLVCTYFATGESIQTSERARAVGIVSTFSNTAADRYFGKNGKPASKSEAEVVRMDMARELIKLIEDKK